MSNQAAWIMAKQGEFEVKESPMPTPGDHEIVIRNRAVALNPCDWIIQKLGIIIDSYPKIIGEDAAGEVHAVGSAVTKFKPGDRVVASIQITFSAGSDGGFQLYSKARESLTAKIPDAIPFKEACVLPLALMTACSALYDKGNLKIPLPKTPAPPATGKTVLIWGGSTSVGSCAIQLAVAAGLDVATTASARNHEHCKKLGAKWVFDYTKNTVIDDVSSSLAGQDVVGVMDAWSRDDSCAKAGHVVLKLGGRKFLQTVMVPGQVAEGVPADIEIGYSNSMLDDADIINAIWGEFLPKALGDGSFKCKPEPFVVGQGLDKIQAASDKGMAGVSAQKLVVELP